MSRYTHLRRSGFLACASARRRLLSGRCGVSPLRRVSEDGGCIASWSREEILLPHVALHVLLISGGLWICGYQAWIERRTRIANPPPDWRRVGECLGRLNPMFAPHMRKTGPKRTKTLQGRKDCNEVFPRIAEEGGTK